MDMIRLISLLVFAFQFNSESMNNVQYQNSRQETKDHISIENAQKIVCCAFKHIKEEHVAKYLNIENPTPTLITYTEQVYNIMRQYNRNPRKAKSLLASSNLPKVTKDEFSNQFKLKEPIIDLLKEISEYNYNQEQLLDLCKNNTNLLEQDRDALYIMIKDHYIFCSTEYLSIINITRRYSNLSDTLKDNIRSLLFGAKRDEDLQENITSYLEGGVKGIPYMENEIKNPQCVESIISRLGHYKQVSKSNEEITYAITTVRKINSIPMFLRIAIGQKLSEYIPLETEKKKRDDFIDCYLSSIHEYIDKIIGEYILNENIMANTDYNFYIDE